MIPVRNLMCVVFASTSLFIIVHGYGSGAPDKACITLTPGHTGHEPQTGPSPYNLTVSKQEFKRGDQMKVKVQGGNYTGLLLQARNPGQDTPVGLFINPPSNTKLKSCSSTSDSVTHENTDIKDDTTEYTWQAPEDGTVGDVVFTVTVAQNHDVYWVKLTSDVIEDLNSGGTTHVVYPQFCLLASVMTILLYVK